MFNCTCCGSCCKNISLSSIYADLNRGDGICKYFDEERSLCAIYEHRPLICNIDAMYEAFYSDKMSRAQYYELNYAACHALLEGQPPREEN